MRTIHRLALVLIAILVWQSAPLSQQPPPSPVTLTGRLEVVYFDYVDKAPEIVYELHVSDRVYVLVFDGPPTDIESGSSVTATGVLTGNTLRLRQDAIRRNASTRSAGLPSLAGGLRLSMARDVAEPATPRGLTASGPVLGTMRILVILMNFPDNTSQPISRDGAIAVMDQVRSFYQDSSYGLFDVQADVAGYYTVTAPSSPCSTTTWASQARALAVAAGFDVGTFTSPYRKIVYAFPGTGACGWQGSAGSSAAYINGQFSLYVVGHEFGHTLSLTHANSVDNNDGVFSPLPGGRSYGDQRDIMGSWAAPLGSFHRERLGWLNYGSAPPITTVAAAGQYRLSSVYTRTMEPKALKVPRIPIAGVNYSGGSLFVDWDGGGDLLIRLGDHTGTTQGLILDTDPSPGGFHQLKVGSTFVDGPRSIRFVSADAAGALVDVSFTSVGLVAPSPASNLRVQ